MSAMVSDVAALEWAKLQNPWDKAVSLLCWGTCKVDLLDGKEERAQNQFFVVSNWGAVYRFRAVYEKYPLGVSWLNPQYTVIGSTFSIIVSFPRPSERALDGATDYSVWILYFPQDATELWGESLASSVAADRPLYEKTLMKTSIHSAQSHRDFSVRPLPLFLSSKGNVSGPGTGINGVKPLVDTKNSRALDTMHAEFEQLIKFSLRGILKEEVPLGLLSNSSIRSVAWRLLLDIFPSQIESIPISLQDRRQCYRKLKEKYVVSREKVRNAIIEQLEVERNYCTGDLPNLSRLIGSSDTHSKKQHYWWLYEENSIIREKVWKDIERTKQASSIFHDKRILNILTNVILVWCHAHKDTGYVQGMNDICATIFEVVFKECMSEQVVYNSLCITAGKLKGQQVILNDILCDKYIEHDTFTLFDHVMSGLQRVYSNFNGEKESCPVYASSVVQRTHFAFEGLVRQKNNRLYQVMRTCDVNELTFMVPWMRLCFLRLIPTPQVFLLWDSLLCASPHQFELLPFLCASILCSENVSKRVFEISKSASEEDRGLHIMKLLTSRIDFQAKELIQVATDARQTFARYEIRNNQS